MKEKDHLAFTSEFDVVKVRKDRAEKTVVPIASEISFNLIGNGTKISKFMCSPADLKELTFGFLYNSGIINNVSDVSSYGLDTKKCIITVSYSDNAGVNDSSQNSLSKAGGKINYTDASLNRCKPIDKSFRIDKEKITGAMKWFQKQSIIYNATNGVHSAALSVNGDLPLKVFEDVARHNAIDKVSGSGLLNKVDFLKSILFCSCRISSEIIFKACRCNIPVVVSLHSPTHQAILLSQKMNITLIGNLKTSGFTIYTCSERIVL